MKTVLIALCLLVLLSGCLTPPNLQTGEGCWRYGVSEINNTGPMTPMHPNDIPVVKLSYEDLLVACNVEDTRSLAEYWRGKRTIAVTACLVPRIVNGNPGTAVIYLHNLYSGKVDLYQEQCHALLGPVHNQCYGMGYPITGSDATACDWNDT